MNKVNRLQEREMLLSVIDEDEKLKYFFDEVNRIEGHKDENSQWHGLIVFYDDNDQNAKPYKTAEFNHGMLHGDTKHFRYQWGAPAVDESQQPALDILLESVFRYEDGVLAYTEIYENNILRELTHEQGKEKGLHKSFYADGKPMEEGYIVDDRKQGTWTVFDLQGRIITRTGYKNGLKEGIEEAYHNGILRLKINWEHGLKHGIEAAYGLTPLAVSVGGMSSLEILSDKSWTQRTYDKGVLEGKYYEIVNGLTVVKGEYAKGAMSGRWEYYENSPGINLVRVENYENGVLHGPIVIRHSDDEVVLGMMQNGKRSGQFDHLNPQTSRPIHSDIYKDGELKFFVEYNSAGKPKEIGQVKNGTKNGLAVAIGEHGEERKLFYREGKEVAVAISRDKELEVLDQLKSLNHSANAIQ